MRARAAPGLRPGVGALVMAAVMWTGLVAGTPGAAQTTGDPEVRTEAQRLRAAAAMEWRGRLDEAEETLEELLDAFPGSTAGLFSLERILRNRGRIAEILPRADALLALHPDDSAVRYMKLRVLAEVDSLSALPAAARAWYEAEPASAAPYQEVARIYARTLGPERALEELGRGRDALGDAPALTLATGDLLAESGREPEAVAAWSLALRDTAAEPAGVLRRVRGLDRADGGTVAPLVQVLTEEPSTPARRVTALRIALGAGDVDGAEALARASLARTDEGERPAFLDAVARVAEEEGAHGLTLWALERRRSSAAGEASVTLDLRMASAALQAGDTAAAVAAQTRLAGSLPRGSTERRRVLGELLRVQASSASAGTLAAQLGDFVRDYPDAPELDELRARAGAGLAARGDTAGARTVLADATGPRVARERGYLELGLGRVEAGLAALEAAVPGVPPREATRLLETVTLLSRVDGPAGVTLAGAAAGVHRGRTAAALEALTAELASFPEDARPRVVAWAASRAADAGDDDRARALYTGLVDAYPDRPGFADAALALARLHLAAGEEGEARGLLQRILLDHPGSPVAPAARRELQRLPRPRGGGS